MMDVVTFGMFLIEIFVWFGLLSVRNSRSPDPKEHVSLSIAPHFFNKAFGHHDMEISEIS